MKDKICYMLKELSVPPHLIGFEYIIDAVEIVLNNHDVLNAVTKELYPAIAKKHNSTGSRVERAIRNAVEHSFDNAPTDVLRSVFGNTINMHTGKVVNTHFIAIVAEVLEHEPNHPIFDGSRFEAAKVPSTYSGRFA